MDREPVPHDPRCKVTIFLFNWEHRERKRAAADDVEDFAAPPPMSRVGAIRAKSREHTIINIDPFTYSMVVVHTHTHTRNSKYVCVAMFRSKCGLTTTQSRADSRCSSPHVSSHTHSFINHTLCTQCRKGARQQEHSEKGQRTSNGVGRQMRGRYVLCWHM